MLSPFDVVVVVTSTEGWVSTTVVRVPQSNTFEREQFLLGSKPVGDAFGAFRQTTFPIQKAMPIGVRKAVFLFAPIPKNCGIVRFVVITTTLIHTKSAIDARAPKSSRENNGSSSSGNNRKQQGHRHRRQELYSNNTKHHHRCSSSSLVYQSINKPLFAIR